MEILAGTSGYAYKHWIGPFYPVGLPESGMLAWYAGRLPTVEINNSFYRMPAVPLLERWGKEVPAGFSFSLKAPRYITHVSRLKDAGSGAAELLRRTAVLGERLGVILFQLPPTFRKDLPRLNGFLDDLPGRPRVAFEFRHASWQDDEVYDALRAHAAALCVAEDDEGTSPFLCTADFAYLRLRRTRYDESDLASWADRIAAQPLARAYVHFKHEDEALATRFALDLGRIGRARGSS